MNNDAFSHFSHGLHLVFAGLVQQKGGCLVNTLIKVTQNPPKLAVAIGRENQTARFIDQAGEFLAIALTPKSDENGGLLQTNILNLEGMRNIHRFPCEAEVGPIPAISRGGAAGFHCTVVDRFPVGSYMIYVGLVTSGEMIEKSSIAANDLCRSAI